MVILLKSCIILFMDLTKNKKITEILKKYPVLFAYVFGSQAKGNAGPLSDLDIAVFFKPSVNQKEQDSALSEIEIAIKELFSKINKIDLIVLNETKYLTPLLEKEIVYDGKVIYSKDENARAHFESLAIGEWLDWEPYQKAYDKAILTKSEI